MSEAKKPTGFDPRCAKCRDASQEQFFTYDLGDGRLWHFDVQRAAEVALAHTPRRWDWSLSPTCWSTPVGTKWTPSMSITLTRRFPCLR